MENRIRLLIVDDEVQFLDSIAERLELRGLDVTKASNGQDALAAASHQKFDLALLDLKMPGMDGAQLLEILKREHLYLEVIMLTGHGSMESAIECTKLGAFDYLPKPYEIEQLLRILKDAFAARLRKKFEADKDKYTEIEKLVLGESPLGILRKLRELDDDRK
ncbi:MAG: response regulator [bacterium]